MSENQLDGVQFKIRKPEIIGMNDVVDMILKEKPCFVYVSDVHITSEPQDVAASLLENISRAPSYRVGDIGFYVEALYDYADPAQGDYSGGVIKWDEFHGEKHNNTHYRETIQRAVRSQIPVHGIDIDKTVDSESEERIKHWESQINKGSEPIKILLVGAGHIWNDHKKTADLVHRLGDNQWIIQGEKAYAPPGYNQMINIDVSQLVPTERKYRIVKYSNIDHN